MTRVLAQQIVSGFWERGVQHPDLPTALELLDIDRRELARLGKEMRRVTKSQRRREILTPSGCGRRS
jgi:hypothetical protein